MSNDLAKIKIECEDNGWCITLPNGNQVLCDCSGANVEVRDLISRRQQFKELAQGIIRGPNNRKVFSDLAQLLALGTAGELFPKLHQPTIVIGTSGKACPRMQVLADLMQELPQVVALQGLSKTKYEYLYKGWFFLVVDLVQEDLEAFVGRNIVAFALDESVSESYCSDFGKIQSNFVIPNSLVVLCKNIEAILVRKISRMGV